MLKDSGRSERVQVAWNPTTRELEKIETQHADNKKSAGDLLRTELGQPLLPPRDLLVQSRRA